MLNQNSFSKISSRTSSARQVLFDVQNQLNGNPLCSSLRQKEKIALEDFVAMSKAEEGFYRQKSHVKWIELGDHNTNYFHKVVQQRFNSNKILSLTRDDGSCIRGHTLISKEAVSHFQNFMNSEAPTLYLGRHYLD